MVQLLGGPTVNGSGKALQFAETDLYDDLRYLCQAREEARWTTYRVAHTANCTKQVDTERGRLLVDTESHSILRLTTDLMPSAAILDLPYTLIIPNREDQMLLREV